LKITIVWSYKPYVKSPPNPQRNRCCMKTIKIENLADQVTDLVSTSPREKILLTRKGKPFALVTDVSNLDSEDLGYINNPNFWNMIANRRKEPLVSSDHVRAKLQAAVKKGKASKSSALIRKRNHLADQISNLDSKMSKSKLNLKCKI
jgi:hypothetical protein